MNGALHHIKQESMMPSSEHQHHSSSEQIHHVIKRELHSEYEDMEHDQQNDGIAEDLTVTSDHTDPGVLDA